MPVDENWVLQCMFIGRSRVCGCVCVRVKVLSVIIIILPSIEAICGIVDCCSWWWWCIIVAADNSLCGRVFSFFYELIDQFASCIFIANF